MTSPGTPAPRIAEAADLDEWVRNVVDIHFHPAHGAPFWIERARELGVDARKAIRGYDDLALLGFFPMDALRTRSVLDFLPAAIAKDRSRLRVDETGGTTGAPARIAVRDFYEPVNVFINWYLDEVVGSPRGGNWLFICPTGPHAVADSFRQMARARRDVLLSIWTCASSRSYQQQDMKTVGRYMKHIRSQHTHSRRSRSTVPSTPILAGAGAELGAQLSLPA